MRIPFISVCAGIFDASIKPTVCIGSEGVIKSTKIGTTRMRVWRFGSGIGPLGNVLTNEWIARAYASIN